MNQPLKYKSKDSAIEVLKRLFSSSPNDDFVNINDAFHAAGRDIEKEAENKAWISNKLPTLKFHNLITVKYSYDTGHRKLDRLFLTLEGKRALGRIGDTINEINKNVNYGNGSIDSIVDIMNIVAQLKKKHPEFDITFDVRLKNG